MRNYEATIGSKKMYRRRPKIPARALARMYSQSTSTNIDNEKSTWRIIKAEPVARKRKGQYALWFAYIG